MVTTSTLDLAVHLRLALTRTARRLRQEAGTDLSPSLQASLASIDRFGPLTPSELAARERVQRPTVTKVLARLEEQGLVERAADPQDRRSSLISVTSAGHELMETIRSRKDAFLARRLYALDSDDRATLERAAAILERLLEEPPK